MNKAIIKTINLILLGILMITSTGAIIVSNEINSLPLIIIDPGHGGPDGGAVSNDGIYEKDIVLAISIKLKYYLEQAGYKVTLTRSGDYDLAPNGSKNHKRDDIHKRVDMINNSNCLLFISIHANSYPNSSIYGSQVFYSNNGVESKLLSESIQETLFAILQNTNRSAKSISGKYLIDNTNKTGSLIEVGFLSNFREASLLKTDIYQDRVAYAIYIGITNYLESIL